MSMQNRSRQVRLARWKGAIIGGLLMVAVAMASLIVTHGTLSMAGLMWLLPTAMVGATFTYWLVGTPKFQARIQEETSAREE